MANRADIEFTSEGNTLRGWLYTDGNDGSQPVIVMAHGYSAVKEQYLDRYAEHFSSLGLASLVFDHPNFGASDGHIRQEVDPWLQVRAYRDAISFAQTLDQIDAERIGVWGSSFSGGHALVTAAIDRRVKCVVSQVPTVDGFLASQRRTPPAQQEAAQERFDADRLARFRGETPNTIPVTSREPGGSCALPGIDAYDFFHETDEFAPSWRDEVTVRSAEMSREYSPATFIERISPTPLLMIVAMKDLLTLTDAQLAAYRDALEPKKLTTIPGGHFSPYVEEFAVTAGAAGEWFSQHLLES